jgi:hypothetical protein
MWTTFVLAAALATPAPPATPPKTIIHERVSPLCTGLRQNIGPAIGKLLQNDATIAQSRPLLRGYVKAAATNSAAKDLQVSRIERLISPLVKNTAAIEKLLADPYVFPRAAVSESDRQLLQIRGYLQQVVAQQKNALDVISGFVQTEQLGQLQQEGSDIYQKIVATREIPAAQGGSGPESAQAAGAAPTPPPSEVLNAGVRNTPQQQADPALQDTGLVLGHNPLDVFDWAIGQYQQQLQSSEGSAADLVVKALPLCGGRVPGP